MRPFSAAEKSARRAAIFRLLLATKRGCRSFGTTDKTRRRSAACRRRVSAQPAEFGCPAEFRGTSPSRAVFRALVRRQSFTEPGPACSPCRHQKADGERPTARLVPRFQAFDVNGVRCQERSRAVSESPPFLRRDVDDTQFFKEPRNEINLPRSPGGTARRSL